MAEFEGVDYSSGRPGGAALAAAGVRFAARYLSHSPSKNLTATEAGDLAAHGVSCVVVWETTAQRAGAGRAAGIADAEEAGEQAKACGMPSGRPVYFAVDYDAAPDDVAAYFQGAASVLGVAHVGAYGGYRVIKYLLDHGLVSWAWQTVAWSGGKWDSRARIRQFASTVRIAGVTCDRNTALAADYGQWMPGLTPTLEEDMPLTDADAKKVAAEVVKEMTGPDARDAMAMAVVYWLARAFDPSIPLPTGKDVPGVVSQTATLRAALAKHAAGTGVTDAQLDTLATRMVGALVAQSK
ncbi:glycoside hydrolase domain-containing protein [Streptomyces sp. NBC_01477]|uniref:glycoside hydrolase domain-containing protein n=1 Tax=Streptomyces sp. NBC_01477 TaxID=2976015 RepID=UPI002E2FF532|nr:glycoside hydrolase domain-containing protein [Streptomyces sp. NBC_01477]